jgi:hypothetical protein
LRSQGIFFSPIDPANLFKVYLDIITVPLTFEDIHELSFLTLSIQRYIYKSRILYVIFEHLKKRTTFKDENETFTVLCPFQRK